MFEGNAFDAFSLFAISTHAIDLWVATAIASEVDVAELSDQFAVALGWIIGTGNNSRSISVPFDKYDEATLRADIERRVREAMEA